MPLLPALVDGLVHMAANFSQSSEILGLILENLTVVLSCDPSFTASQEAKVAPLAIAIFLRYSSDPVITTLSQDIFKVLAAIPACSGPLQGRLVPTLLSILNAQDNAQSGLKSTALDVLGTLVRSSPLPLSDPLMQAAFPAIVQAVLQSDDNAVLQSGGEALRAYMAAAPDQVVALTDPATGTSGLQQIVSVAGYLLNPAGSEFAATFVGRLVTTLIQKAGPGRLGDNLDLLLKAVLSKLQRTETLSVIQSLVMVYAQLIHSELDAVLGFLSGVPGPTGQSALHFVMSEWVSRQHLFYGAYESKVSLMALAKLLQYGVNNNDDRLNEITVRGEEVFSESNGPRTRSARAAKPDQWTSVPLLAKIFKLLLVEMNNQMELNEESDDDDEDEDEGGDWDDDSQESDSGHNVSGGKAPKPKQCCFGLLTSSPYNFFSSHCYCKC